MTTTTADTPELDAIVRLWRHAYIFSHDPASPARVPGALGWPQGRLRGLNGDAA